MPDDPIIPDIVGEILGTPVSDALKSVKESHPEDEAVRKLQEELEEALVKLRQTGMVD